LAQWSESDEEISHAQEPNELQIIRSANEVVLGRRDDILAAHVASNENMKLIERR